MWLIFLHTWSLHEQGHLIEQPFVGGGNTKRALLTKPYDIGLPVFILSNQARLEVESIAALRPLVHKNTQKLVDE